MRRQQRVVAFLATLGLTVITCGCWDAKELEQAIYINALGIDYQNGNYIAYAQVINFGNLGKTEGSAGRMPEQVWIGRGYGKTIDLATDNMYQTAQQRLSWAHIKGVVISEAALKHGRYDEMLDTFDRFPEVRDELRIYGTTSPVEELMTTLPILNISPVFTRLISPVDIYKQYSVVAPLTLREFDMYLHEPAKTLVFPYLTISEDRWRKNRKNHPSMMLDGVAIIKHGTYQAALRATDTMGFRWIQKKSERAPVYLFEAGEPVGVLAMDKPKSKIKLTVVDGKPRFTLQVKTSGLLVEVLKPKTEAEFIALGTKQIESEVRKLYQTSLDTHTDLLQLEDTLYKKEPKLWKRLTAEGPLQLDEHSLTKVEVKVKLTASGKTKLRTQRDRMP